MVVTMDIKWVSLSVDEMERSRVEESEMERVDRRECDWVVSWVDESEWNTADKMVVVMADYWVGLWANKSVWK
jgi:hypothetical protein